MTKEELRILVISAIEALKKSKGLDLELVDMIENKSEGLLNFIILYYSSKPHKLTLSFHTSPLPEFNLDIDGVGIGKTIVKRIYADIKFNDNIDDQTNP